MTEKEFETLWQDTLLPQIDDLLRRRLELIHDLIEVLAHSTTRIEQRLDPAKREKPSDTQLPRPRRIEGRDG